MHWIIQNNIFSEQQWDVLLDTMKRFNLSYSEHKVVPFIGELLPDPNLGHNNAICIGSYSMRHIAKKKGWYPGVFDIFEQDFEVQRKHWGKHLLNYNCQVVPFKDAVVEDIAFIRPTTDSKAFSGKVFEKKEFDEWHHNVCDLEVENGSSLKPDTLVQVSDPINIFAEYRFWIVKNKIVTCSLYKRGTRVIYSPEVDQRFIDYVNEVISIWAPHETFVIDVADTADGIKIVEPNTLNAAGFYAGNLQKLIFTLDQEYTIL